MLVPAIFFGQTSNKFSTYYNQRYTLFLTLPTANKANIFFGDSITDGNEWSEFFKNKKVINRGISGDTTEGLLYRLPEILRHNPKAVFILIGTNDLAGGVNPETILLNIFKISDEIKKKVPKTYVYVQSILPVSDNYKYFANHVKNNPSIDQLNEKLKSDASKHNYTFIDINSLMKSTDGKLDSMFTNDGLHLSGQGYKTWAEAIEKYVK